MKYYETFKRIVEWMMSEKGIDTNTIIGMADISMKEYTILIEADVRFLAEIHNSTIAKIQDFNKKHMSNFLEFKSVEKLPQKEDPTPNDEKIKSIEEELSQPYINSAEEHYSQRIKEREREKHQEEIFYNKLKQLHDAVPDHMTFEIFIKLIK